MFLERLKQLAARLVGRRGPFPGSWEDPYAGVREPRTHRPGGRNSAVAVSESEPYQSVGAIGRTSRRAQRR